MTEDGQNAGRLSDGRQTKFTRTNKTCGGGEGCGGTSIKDDPRPLKDTQVRRILARNKLSPEPRVKAQKDKSTSQVSSFDVW